MLGDARQRGNKGKEEAAADPKAKGAPTKGAPPPKKEEKKGSAPGEDESKEEKPLPDASAHVNEAVKGFFEHFASDRVIYIPCDKSQARVREEGEKETIRGERE